LLVPQTKSWGSVSPVPTVVAPMRLQTIKFCGFSTDRTSIYDKHLNKRQSVTLGKHCNEISFWPGSTTDPAGEVNYTPQAPSLSPPKPSPLRTPPGLRLGAFGGLDLDASGSSHLLTPAVPSGSAPDSIINECSACIRPTTTPPANPQKYFQSPSQTYRHGEFRPTEGLHVPQPVISQVPMRSM